MKLNLKSAYRIVPVHPQDHHLLAVSWEGETYVDCALPFGLRSAPKIFSAVADMISWALHVAGIPHQLHYLDDFLFLGAPNTDEGERALELALQIFEFLGIPVAAHKTEGPSTCVTFLGILIDTVRCELRLPVEKLQRLQALLHSWCSGEAHTKKELESLLGHLCYAASIVRPGRTFLRELFGLLRKVGLPHHYVRLNAGVSCAFGMVHPTLWSISTQMPQAAMGMGHSCRDGVGCRGDGRTLGRRLISRPRSSYQWSWRPPCGAGIGPAAMFTSTPITWP